MRRASELRDPAYNAAAARVISDGGFNWEPWTVYRTGAYELHKGKDFTIRTGHPRADQWNA